MSTRRATLHRSIIAPFFVTAIFIVAGAASAGGTWSDPGTSTFSANARADYTHPAFPPCNAPNITEVDTPPDVANFIPGFLGSSFGRYHQATVFDNDEPACSITAHGFSRTIVNGIGSSVVDVRWKNGATANHFCECNTPECDPLSSYTYDAGGAAGFDALIEVVIDTVPPGQPVTVHYSWWALINNFYDPENPALPDDPASTTNITLEVLGTDLIPPGSSNFNDLRALHFLPGNPSQSTGSFQAQGGDTVTIRVRSEVLARIQNPPDVCFRSHDFSEAHYQGQILLSIDDPLPPLPNPAAPGNALLEFSVDIGSDAEMSDPSTDGNEVFDPGDMYPWFGPRLPLGGADGVRDDALAFQTDFWPLAPDGPPPATGAETCVHPSPLPADLTGERFDLDGSDAIDLELRFVIPPSAPLEAPLSIHDSGAGSGCIIADPFLLISYNDDWAPHYAWNICSVPSESTSEMGFTYGTDADDDEVLMVSTTPIWPPTMPTPRASVDSELPILSEASLHDNLAPSPDPAISEALDDDVDALDVNLGNARCEVWYISADHEAAGQHPALPGTLLDPGDIYEVLALGGVTKVIDHSIHLGLRDGTDINAFEFVWLRHCLQDDPTSCQTVLALLFSVDENDFLSPGDESGGLDPRMIYASFMTGSHFAYLTSPLEENIDAIAASALPFVPAGVATLTNDHCANATSIMRGTTMLTNVNATTDGPLDACGFTGVDDSDVWFQFVAECDRAYAFTLTPLTASPSNKLAIYNNCPQAGGVQLACDNTPALVPATVPALSLIAGQNIWIRVGTDLGAAGQGHFNLDIDFATACPADLTGSVGSQDCVVNLFDLLALLAQWGPCPPGLCPADVANSGGCGAPDGVVNVFDLLCLLGSWGPCP